MRECERVRAGCMRASVQGVREKERERETDDSKPMASK